MTPEGKVKEKVKKLLKLFNNRVYYHMPVQNGMGMPSLDFICCAKSLFGGLYFAIETKAPGGGLTPRQQVTVDFMANAGGKVFVIDGDTTALEQWLYQVTAIG